MSQLKEIWRPEIARMGDIVISLQLLVSLWNSVRSYIVFSAQRTIQKNVLQRPFAIIAGPTCNNRKRTFLLAAFGVSFCFARRMIELTKNVPGLNRQLVRHMLLTKMGVTYKFSFTYFSLYYWSCSSHFLIISHTPPSSLLILSLTTLAIPHVSLSQMYHIYGCNFWLSCRVYQLLRAPGINTFLYWLPCLGFFQYEYRHIFTIFDQNAMYFKCF